MPDPPPKRRARISDSEQCNDDVSRGGPAYAELHCKTNFSFLRGASHPDELVARAAALGYRSLAITDRHTLSGVVRAHAAAKPLGLKLLIGAEIWPLDAPPLLLWASDRASYGRLARLVTLGCRQAEKGECHLRFEDVAAHASGLLAGAFWPDGSEAAVPAPGESRHMVPTIASMGRYREIFGDRLYLLAEWHHRATDGARLEKLIGLGRRARVALATAGDVYYHEPARAALADVLAAIRLGCAVRDAGEHLFPNRERSLRPRDELAELWCGLPAAMARSVEVADRCGFSLDELRYEYPEELCPAGETPLRYLIAQTWAGAAERYPGGIPEKVRGLLVHELELIESLGYEAYFLTVWDLVRFARERGILCQGRGSAANSAVCFALGVTSVDPEQIDVLFERFVSRERQEAPDIDVDFEHERREEVIQYLYDKYGRERCGMTAEVITYRPRSAVRDVGKALGLSLERVDALAKTLDSYRTEPNWPERLREAGLDPETIAMRQLVALVDTLCGFPRHLSQHVGGLVMTRGALCELVPIENAAMPGRTVIQWDKDDLDDVGMLKVDCLALGMLTAISKALALVEQHAGRRLTLASIEPEDPAVYAMICRADTVGVFQIESRAQMSMLPRLRPQTFYDLVIEVAIVRPGPIQGDMVHPYLRRRAGLESAEYPNDEIRRVLEKTLGVPIFQEQAMRLAVVAAGFTPGEADQLRRAMGAWRRPGVIEQFRQKLLLGMRERGLSETFAEQVFHQIRGFGEYGFPESHAASFARLVYVSAWLKHYYQAAFTAALLNSQPMGFYAPAQLVRDAQRHGVEVLPPDVNHSDWECTLEPREVLPREESKGGEATLSSASSGSLLEHAIGATAARGPIRMGLCMVAGFGRAAAEAVVAQRRHGKFRSLSELARRARLGRGAIVRLAQADAFGSLGLSRRQALWEALPCEPPQPLFAGLDDDEADDADLPELSLGEEITRDYRTRGLSLRAHPVSLLRADLEQLRVTPAAKLVQLPKGKRLWVAGLVLLRQRPGSASGVTFVTLEDETGLVNLIVRPTVWERYRHTARSAQLLLAHGQLERQGEVIHVLVSRMENLNTRLGQLKVRSRDFR